MALGQQGTTTLTEPLSANLQAHYRVVQHPIADPRDIVIVEALPNEMPRVGGIITTVPQTPLSHVNLRAIQDGVPNAFIAGAVQNAAIAPLIGKHVHYRVAADGYVLREATLAERGGARIPDLPAQPAVEVIRELPVHIRRR